MPPTGNTVPDPVELWRHRVFHAGPVRPTLSARLVGVVPGVRVADGGLGLAAKRQAHVQGEPGPERAVVRGPPAALQTVEVRDQHRGQRGEFERHGVRTARAFSVSFGEIHVNILYCYFIYSERRSSSFTKICFLIFFLQNFNRKEHRFLRTVPFSETRVVKTQRTLDRSFFNSIANFFLTQRNKTVPKNR